MSEEYIDISMAEFGDLFILNTLSGGKLDKYIGAVEDSNRRSNPSRCTLLVYSMQKDIYSEYRKYITTKEFKNSVCRTDT